MDLLKALFILSVYIFFASTYTQMDCANKYFIKYRTRSQVNTFESRIMSINPI